MADFTRWERASLAEFAAQAMAKLQELDEQLSQLRNELEATHADRRMLLERWRETTRNNETLLMKVGALERKAGQR